MKDSQREFLAILWAFECRDGRGASLQEAADMLGVTTWAIRNRLKWLGDLFTFERIRFSYYNWRKTVRLTQAGKQAVMGRGGAAA